MRAYDSPTPYPSNRSHFPLFGHRRSVAVGSLRSVVLLLLITGGAIAPHAEGGSITYDVVNYPDLQNGYTVSGTITTDGNTGTISLTDITSWDISVSLSGVNQFTLTPFNSGDDYSSPTLTATTTALTVSTSPLQWLTIVTPTESSGLHWGTGYWAFNGSYDWYFSYGQVDISLVASAVPEPSSLVLSGMAAVGVMAYMGRRRKPVVPDRG